MDERGDGGENCNATRRWDARNPKSELILNSESVEPPKGACSEAGWTGQFGPFKFKNAPSEAEPTNQFGPFRDTALLPTLLPTAPRTEAKLGTEHIFEGAIEGVGGFEQDLGHSGRRGAIDVVICAWPSNSWTARGCVWVRTDARRRCGADREYAAAADPTARAWHGTRRSGAARGAASHRKS